jgi:hypothetical protein
MAGSFAGENTGDHVGGVGGGEAGSSEAGDDLAEEVSSLFALKENWLAVAMPPNGMVTVGTKRELRGDSGGVIGV